MYRYSKNPAYSWKTIGKTPQRGGVIVLIIVLMLSLLAGCMNEGNTPLDSNTNEPNDSDSGSNASDQSQQGNIEKFSYSDLVLGELTPPFTKEKIKALYGAPQVGQDKNRLGDIPWPTWNYDGAKFTFGSAEVFPSFEDNAIDVEISNNRAALPRDIKIGDSFESVLAKFPQEYDYTTHEHGFLYGKYTLPPNTRVKSGRVENDFTIAYDTTVEKALLLWDEKGSMNIYFSQDKVIQIILTLTHIDG